MASPYYPPIPGQQPPVVMAQPGYAYPPQPVVYMPPPPPVMMVQQPVHVTQIINTSRQAWSASLCGCCDDCGSCCMVFWGCGACVYADNVKKLRGGGCCGPCCCYCTLALLFPPGLCCLGGNTRGEIRNKYNLMEQPCGDCCTHCWCHHCALCQESRELKRHC